MTNVEMAREILGLASGTVAGLCKSTRYDVLEQYTERWVGWVLTQPSLRQWTTWQSCHTEYRRFLEGGE